MARVRRAGMEDAAAIAAIEVETWRTTYAGILDDEMLVGMSVERTAWGWVHQLRHRLAGAWVWQDEDGTVLGFGSCGHQRLPDLGYTGEVTMLYVLPDAQGQGIGRELLLTMFADLKHRGMNSALIWVIEANPSRFFYGHMGGAWHSGAVSNSAAAGWTRWATAGPIWPPL